VRIAATPETVFPYFVDPALITEWLATWAELAPQPGGLFAVNVRTDVMRGTYVAVEPPHRVVFTWGVPGSDIMPAGSTTVEVLLTADGSDTVVELIHRDLPLTERESHRAGWPMFLRELGQRLA
jgi:uncharacterized protein YndB with AHSA1/START domain